MQKNVPSFSVLIGVGEDDKRLFFERLLAGDGYRVCTVRDNATLLDTLAQARFDLLLLDYRLIRDNVEARLEEVRKRDRRMRLVFLYDKDFPHYRKLLKETHLHACFDLEDSAEKLLLCLDGVLKNLPKIDLISSQFEKIKTQIRISEKNKEGLRYIISAMPETINRLQPLDKFIKGVLTQICGFLGSDNSFLATLDKNEKLILLVGVGAFDVDEKAFLKSSFHAIHREDVRRAVETFKTTIRDRYVVIPLKAKNKVLGIFYLEKSDRELDALEEDMLKLFASQAAITIENSSLFEMATIDGLTGLFVRRHFFTRLQEILQYASRMGRQPVSIFLMDIDHFKKINDTYGHAAGDVVLRELAAFIKSNIRMTDVAGRLGGEELAVILVNTRMEEAGKIAEALREKIRHLSFAEKEHRFSVSMSFGVAGYAAYSFTPERVAAKSLDEILEEDIAKLLRAADQALYMSKEQGRDRVTMAPVIY